MRTASEQIEIAEVATETNSELAWPGEWRVALALRRTVVREILTGMTQLV